MEDNWGLQWQRKGEQRPLLDGGIASERPEMASLLPTIGTKTVGFYSSVIDYFKLYLYAAILLKNASLVVVVVSAGY